jgi:hypothetical protein
MAQLDPIPHWCLFVPIRGQSVSDLVLAMPGFGLRISDFFRISDFTLVAQSALMSG